MAKVGVVAALVVLIAAPELWRAGYSVDEEFTIFAVRGIAAHGVPVLPSGFLYDRGVAYSYACWLVSVLPGPELVWFRALGLAAVVLALGVLFSLLRRQFGDRASALAVAAAASSIPFFAAATSARFYGPFLMTCALVILFMTRRSLWGIFIAAIFCRWTHELAFTLVAIPAIGFVLADRSERARWMKTAVVLCAALGVAQIALFGLHYLVPSSGDTAIRRFFIWQVLNLFERPPDRQFSIAAVVMIIGWLVAPRRAGVFTVVSLCVVALILGMSTARALQSAPLSAQLIVDVLAAGSRYPLRMFWHIASVAPLIVVMVLLGLVARLRGLGGEWSPAERALHLAWVGWVLWFGVIDSGITVNYQLMPMTAMLLAVGIDLFAIAGKGQGLALATVILMIAAGSQWFPAGILGRSRPTIDVAGIDGIRAGLRPSDRVACTDELACLLLVARDDAWLALDDFVRARFLVTRADYSSVGVYGGAPAVFRPAELFGDIGDKKTPERVLIVDVFKEYPVGNSRTWLPRALAMDGIEGKILLETPQARVVQISAPVRNAQVIP